MKKIILFATALALALTLAACGSSAEGEVSPVNPEGDTLPSSSSPAIMPEPTPEPMQLFPARAEIEETVLADNDNFTITLNSLTYEQNNAVFYGSVAPVLHFTCVNKTTQQLDFELAHNGCIAVNGCTVPLHNYAPGPAGETVTLDITLPARELYLSNITDIQTLEIGFSVHGEDHFEDVTEVEPVVIQTSLTESAPTASLSAALENEDVLTALGLTVEYQNAETVYDDGRGAVIASEALISDASGERSLLLEMQNNGADSYDMNFYSVYFDDIAPASLPYDTYVIPGTRYITEITYVQDADDPAAALFPSVSRIDIQMHAMHEEITSIEEMFGHTDYTLTISDTPPTVDVTGTELFADEANGIQVLCLGYSRDENGVNFPTYLLIRNTGTRDVLFDHDDEQTILINGQPTDQTFYSDAVPSGKSQVELIRIFDTDLPAGMTDIEEVTSMEIPFTLVDTNDGSTLATGALNITY